MNLCEWEIKNRKLVNKMESFYENYQEQNSDKFEKDWVEANKEMCQIAARRYKKEIKNQINNISY